VIKAIEIKQLVSLTDTAPAKDADNINAATDEKALTRNEELIAVASYLLLMAHNDPPLDPEVLLKSEFFISFCFFDIAHKYGNK